MFSYTEIVFLFLPKELMHSFILFLITHRETSRHDFYKRHINIFSFSFMYSSIQIPDKMIL